MEIFNHRHYPELNVVEVVLRDKESGAIKSLNIDLRAVKEDEEIYVETLGYEYEYSNSESDKENLKDKDSLLKELLELKNRCWEKRGVTVSTEDGLKWDADRKSSEAIYGNLQLYCNAGKVPDSFKWRDFTNVMRTVDLSTLQEISYLCWEHDERIKQNYWLEKDRILNLADVELADYRLPSFL